MTDRPNQIVMASTYDDQGQRVVLLAWYPEDRNIPSEYSAHYQDVEGFCYSGRTSPQAATPTTCRPRSAKATESSTTA